MSENHVESDLSGVERDIAQSVPAATIAARLAEIQSRLDDDTRVRIRFLIARGFVENRLGDPQKALTSAHEARGLATDKSSIPLRSAISRLHATIYAWRGKGEKAMAELLRAIAEARVAGNPEDELCALAEAVRAAKEIKRFDVALVFLDAVLGKPAGLDRLAHARALIDRLQILNRLERFDACLEAAEECREVMDGTYQRLKHLRLLEVARALAGLGRFPEARAILEEDRANLPEDEGEYEHLEWTQASVHVGAVEDAAGKSGAEDALFRIIERFRIDSLHKQEADARLELAEHLSSKGETEGALGQAAAALKLSNLHNDASLMEQARSLLLRLAISERAGIEDGGRLVSERYLLGGRLGQGGYGYVRSAYDLQTGSRRAIKFIDLHNITNPALRAQRYADAKAEINSASRVRHPCLVRVHTILSDGDTIAIVQDIAEGTPLEYLRNSRTGPAVLIGMLVKVAHAVSALHNSGIVHRDLKPGNIIVDALFRPTLIDLGLAAVAGSMAEASAIARGTREYMAPELLLSGQRPPPDPRQDIYSFGIICREFLGGLLDADKPPIFWLFGRDRKREFAKIVPKMAATEPHRRPSSMADIAEILEAESERHSVHSER